jgi:hypothetical protein
MIASEKVRVAESSECGGVIREAVDRTMKTTISTAVAMIETKPSTMPAMAMPRPFSPVCRIWLIAIKPRTIARIPARIPTRIWPIPQYRDAIASEFVLRQTRLRVT